jgi:hypothetical protein
MQLPSIETRTSVYFAFCATNASAAQIYCNNLPIDFQFEGYIQKQPSEHTVFSSVLG